MAQHVAIWEGPPLLDCLLGEEGALQHGTPKRGGESQKGD